VIVNINQQIFLYVSMIEGGHGFSAFQFVVRQSFDDRFHNADVFFKDNQTNPTPYQPTSSKVSTEIGPPLLPCHQSNNPMKTLFSALLVAFCTAALAQQTNSLAVSVSDNRQTLTISVDGEQNGKPLRFERTYNVAALNDSARAALKTRVLDSLGVGPSAAPLPPMVPGAPGTSAFGDQKPTTLTLRCEACQGRMHLEVAGNGYALARTWNNPTTPPFPLTISLLPGEYRYQYWQNGVLQMQVPFTVKAGQANTVAVKW
jgi:hypothetical protein